MIQVGTKLTVADNTGAKIVQCIKVLSGAKHRYARIGDRITVAIKEAEPRRDVKKGDVRHAVVARQKQAFKRRNASNFYIRFDDNACILIEDFKPIGKRIFGPIPRELREKFPNIISQAKEIL